MQLRRTGRLVASIAGLVLASVTAAHAQALDAFAPGASARVQAVALQPDGKILIGGQFTTVGGGTGTTTTRNYIARLNVDGTVDAAFNPGANSYVYAIAVQPDGKILVGGVFTSLGGGTGNLTPRRNIGRLNADGTVDAGFDPGASVSSQITTIVLQPDGRILVAGTFTGLGGSTGTTPRAGIGRLESNGTVDATFNPGASGGPVYAFAVQPDGNIVIGGTFTGLGGGTGSTSRLGIGRVSGVDGSVDATFNPGVLGDVTTIVIQPNGQILVGGPLTGLGGGTGATPRSGIGRLNSNGSVDTFNPGAGAQVNTIALQADGRILVGGPFIMLGGGGTGTTLRNRIGRLNADGSLDGTFNPGAGGAIQGMVIQPDGRIVVVGDFAGLGGGTGATARVRLGRIMNTDPALQSLAVSGGGTAVTWLRSGVSPEVDHVQFASSPDGVTYTDLGTGTRIVGGWELTGLGVAASPNMRIRARGFYQGAIYSASGSIAETIAPLSGTNIIENGDFGNGTTSWLLFATPDLTYIDSNVTSGVFQFYRKAPPPGTSNQALVFQNTGMPLPPLAPIEAQFQLGNTDSVRKRISVLMHDSSFADLSVCTFWLPANTPLTTYTMRTHTTQVWADATISFYAASANAAINTTGYYQLDNVSVRYVPTNALFETQCVDAQTPAAPGGPIGSDLLTNGNFNTGLLTPWTTFGQITGAVTSNVFEFIKVAGTPAGVVLQATTQAMTAGQILESTFQLGNSSGVRKRVTVILHDNNFSDLSACTFWVPPGQALSSYTYRTYATQAWANATVSVYPATAGADQWIRLDNVTLRQVPAVFIQGTECYEPGTVFADAPLARAAVRPSGPVFVPTQRDDTETVRDGTDGWLADGFLDASDTGAPGTSWVTTGASAGRRVLQLGDPIDLANATAASLLLRSWLTSAGSRAEIQVSVDGVTWETVRVVAPPSDTWMPVEVNLGDYLGEVVHVRFVFDVTAPADAAAPDTWRIEDIVIEVTGGPPQG